MVPFFIFLGRGSGHLFVSYYSDFNFTTMGQIQYDYTKSSIIRVSNNKVLFVKELMKAYKLLLPHEKENLINWLFYFTADKPEVQKWLYEYLDKYDLVS